MRITANWQAKLTPLQDAVFETKPLLDGLVFNRMKEALSPKSRPPELEFSLPRLFARFGVALGVGIAPGKSVSVYDIKGPSRRRLCLLRAEMIFDPAVVAASRCEFDDGSFVELVMGADRVKGVIARPLERFAFRRCLVAQ